MGRGLDRGSSRIVILEICFDAEVDSSSGSNSRSFKKTMRNERLRKLILYAKSSPSMVAHQSVKSYHWVEFAYHIYSRP